MMDELKKVPIPQPIEIPNQKTKMFKRKPHQQIRKKTRNLIKEKTESTDTNEQVNPISRLIQIQQASKQKEPNYELIEERGEPRRREFVMRVTAGGQSGQGTGPNKKIAKRIAAESKFCKKINIKSFY